MSVRFGLPRRLSALATVRIAARSSAGVLPLRAHALPRPAPAVVLPSTHLPAAARLISSSRVRAHAQPTDAEQHEPMRFAELEGKIGTKMLRALTDRPFGYETMSEVQSRVCEHLPSVADAGGSERPTLSDGSGRDMLVKAKTGTGKTLAFLIPAVQRRINTIGPIRSGIISDQVKSIVGDISDPAKAARIYRTRAIGTLIISPTRELAMQIFQEAQKLTTGTDLGTHLLCGGDNRNMQLRGLMTRPRDIVVATPGRLQDFLESVPEVAASAGLAETLVLDECDTLLEMGFRDALEKIIEYLPDPDARLNLLFSATVSREIRRVSSIALSDAHRYIDCVPPGEENVHKHIPQRAIVVKDAADTLPTVAALISQDQVENKGTSKVIVFCQSTKMVSMISQLLRDISPVFPVRRTYMFELTSAKTQQSRSRVSQQFRQSKGNSVLVTSDVSARGVDYPGTTRVIQVGVPSTADTYVHRIGRTGRAGANGRADLVIAPYEKEFVIQQIQDLPITITPYEEVLEEFDQLGGKTIKELRETCAEVVEEVPTDVLQTTLGAQSGFYSIVAPLMRLKTHQMVPYITNWFREFAPKAGLELQEPFTSSGRGSRGSFGGSRGGYGRGGYSSRGGFEGEDDFGGPSQSRGGFGQSRGGYGQSRGGFGQSRGGFGQSRGGFGASRGGFKRGGGDRDSFKSGNRFRQDEFDY